MSSRYVEFEPGAVHLRHGTPPSLPEGWARVQVTACGICGTDQHMLEGMELPPGVSYPVRPGHEVAGRITELATEATGLRVGDQVVLHPLAPCGTCEACLAGAEHRCADARILGIHEPGGMADEVLWPADRLVPVGDLPAAEAALLPDAVATAYHALVAAELPAGGTLCVIGAGGVGTHLLQLAQILHPDTTLIAVVRSRATAERVRSSLGIEVIEGLDGAHRAVRTAVGEVDVVADFSGAPGAAATGVRMLRRGGRLLLGSVVDEPVDLGVTMTVVVMRELQVVGTYSSTIADLRAVAELAVDGRLDLSGSASTRMPLDDAAAAMDTLAQRPAGLVRLVLEP